MILHRPGLKNPADAPCRRPDYAQEDGPKTEDPYQQKLFERLRISLQQGPFADSEATKIAATSAQDPQEVNSHRPVAISIAVDECQAVSATDGPEHLSTRAGARNTLAGETALNVGPTASMVEFIRTVQSQDADLQRISRKLEVTGTAGSTKGTQWSKSASDGLLRFEDRVSIPHEPALIEEIMRTHHDNPQAGHYREKRTLEAIRRKYHWNGMREQIKEYVQNCHLCQLNAVHRHRPYGLLEPLPVLVRP